MTLILDANTWRTIVTTNSLTDPSQLTYPMIAAYADLTPFTSNEARSATVKPSFSLQPLAGFETYLGAELVSLLETLEGVTGTIALVSAQLTVARVGIDALCNYTIEITTQPTQESELARFQAELADWFIYDEFNMTE